MTTSPPSRAELRTSDHLANERTFLAWIRTSIAILGLGFVVARFSVWLRQITVQSTPTTIVIHHSGWSLPLGILMMAFAGIVAVIAMMRYRRVRHAIENGMGAASGHAVTLVTILTLAITISLVAYMIISR